MSLALPETLDLLRAYDADRVSRQDLEAALAGQVMTPPPSGDQEAPPRSEAQVLAYNIAEAVCSDSGPEESVRLFARRVLDCTAQVSDPGDVLDLLPLIKHHDEFNILVAKHARGLITAPGMRSIIAKRFHFDAIQQQLEAASIDQLQAVCDLVEANKYDQLQMMLGTL